MFIIKQLNKKITYNIIVNFYGLKLKTNIIQLRKL